MPSQNGIPFKDGQTVRLVPPNGWLFASDRCQNQGQLADQKTQAQTLDQVGWNARLVWGEIAAEVGRLKSQPGKYLSVGGAELAWSFIQQDLIDQYRLDFTPVIPGGGKPMCFPTTTMARTSPLLIPLPTECPPKPSQNAIRSAA